jgi:hypothetical protein
MQVPLFSVERYGEAEFAPDIRGACHPNLSPVHLHEFLAYHQAQSCPVFAQGAGFGIACFLIKQGVCQLHLHANAVVFDTDDGFVGCGLGR